MFRVCVLLVSVAAERSEVPSRSLLQKDAVVSASSQLEAADDIDEKKPGMNLALDVKVMEQEVTIMREKMKVVQSTLGGISSEPSETASGTAKTNLQQIDSDVGKSLKERINALEESVADLLSRTGEVETDVGVPPEVVYLLDITKNEDSEIGLARRAVTLHVKVHELQKRITKMEYAVLVELTPSVNLLKKDAHVLEGKVKTLKAGVQGPAASLLEIDRSDGGLKAQVSDLEVRVGELLGTTATLETEINGITASGGGGGGGALLQKETTQAKAGVSKLGLSDRVSDLKTIVSNLKSRVFALENRVRSLS